VSGGVDTRGPRLGPLDRPLESPRQRGDRDVLRVEPTFGTECTADIRRHDADRMFGDTEDAGDVTTPRLFVGVEAQPVKWR